MKGQVADVWRGGSHTASLDPASIALRWWSRSHLTSKLGGADRVLSENMMERVALRAGKWWRGSHSVAKTTISKALLEGEVAHVWRSGSHSKPPTGAEHLWLVSVIHSDILILILLDDSYPRKGCARDCVTAASTSSGQGVHLPPDQTYHSTERQSDE